MSLNDPASPCRAHDSVASGQGAMRQVAREYLRQRCAIAPRTLKLRHKRVARRRARTCCPRGRLHTRAARISPVSPSKARKATGNAEIMALFAPFPEPFSRGRPRDITAMVLHAIHLLTASCRADTLSCPACSAQSRRVEFSKYLLAAGHKHEHPRNYNTIK